MLQGRSSVRIIISGFAIIAILALSVAAENSWSDNFFAAIQEFLGVGSSSAPAEAAVSNGEIVFQRGFGTPGAHMFVVDSAGTSEADFDGGEDPSWRPDGSKIIFSFTRQLWMINADGTNQQPVTDAAGISIIGENPSWSPDGQKIVFIRNSQAGFPGSIFKMDITINPDGTVRGTNQVQLTTVTTDAFPAWQPTAAGQNGALIAFQRSADIFTISSTNGANATNITNNPNADRNPNWSPDGTKIVFSSSRAAPNNGDIWKMNPDGTGLVQLTSDTFEDAYPTFSPDGTKIAWSSGSGRNGTGSSDRIFVMNADGSGITGPVSATGFDTNPSWGISTAAPINLQVVVRDSADPVVADSPLTYIVSVTNNGSTTVPNVEGNVAIDSETLLVPANTSSGCVRVGATRNIQCTFGSITAGDTISKQIAVRPTGRATPVHFNIGVTNGADSSRKDIDETTTVTAATRPPNDNFVACPTFPVSQTCPPSVTGPIRLNGASGLITGTNVGATREVPINYGLGNIDSYEVNHANVNGGKSVWYVWTPPASTTGAMAVDTIGSNFDTLLAVYSQSLSDGTVRKEIVSNNDISEFNPTSTTPTASQVFFQFDSKYAYYIAVDGKQGATGNLTLNWRSVPAASSTTRAAQNIDIGIFPSVTCTSGSTASDICDGAFDSSGYFLLKIKGRNFTGDSQVMIRGVSVTNMHGFDRSGRAVTGQVSLTSSTEIQARIPPNPPLNNVDINSIRVVTRRPGSFPEGGNGAESTTDSVLNGLANGTYDTSFGSRGLLTIEAQKVVIPPHSVKTVCFNLANNGAAQETCIDFDNEGQNSATLYPTDFAAYGSCVESAGGRQADIISCKDLLKNNSSFALNAADVSPLFYHITKRIDLPPNAIQAIRDNNGTIAIGYGGGKIAAGIISNDGASIVAQGGGNIISVNGGGIISVNGGGIVAQGGGNIVAQGGGNIVAQGAGNLITNDGGSIIGNDGASFRVINGLITNDGGSRPELSLIDRMAGKTDPEVDDRHMAPTTTSAVSSGVGGMLLAKSSGGQEATVTTETDPVTGEVKAYVSITLDDTSFPRASDANGLAFTALVNPPVAQFASNTMTVNKADGIATATLNRTGDKTGEMTVEYKTQGGTANDRTDYSPVFGSVTFAPGETTKQITIPIIKHGYGTTAFGAQRKFDLIITNVTGGAMQTPNNVAVTITNTDIASLPTNPLDNADAQFFVRQQYLDLLGREPTAGQLSAAVALITQCGSDQVCVRSKLVDMSYSTFLQNNQAAAYVFRLYRASYGNNQPFPNPDSSNLTEAKKVPAYAAFLGDRVTIAEGANFAASQLALANAFVLRPEFVQKYPTDTLPDGPSFVDAVLTTIRNDSGIDLTAQRTALIGLFDQAGGSAQGRGVVMYRLAEEAQSNPIGNGAFINAEYDRAFASTLYFGYLKRDGDIAGINSWKSQLDAAPLRDATTQKGVVDAFLSMVGYRARFGVAVATVGGRVVTSDGRGLRNATVSITDSQGVVQTATTSSFGLFSFSNVLTGGTYTVKISSRLYRFASRTIQVTDNLTLPDFAGLE